MGRRRPDHPVTAYARAVADGKLPAGRLHRLACERHLRDLDTGEQRGLRFNDEAAFHAIEFFRFLKHSKGEWAGSSFELSPWQQFIVGSIFGWMRADGARRFRTAYHEIPRKNGKSTLAAGIGLYLLIADNEPGAEVYTAATKRDQARITHGEARRMVLASPALRRRIRVLKDNLHVEASNSKYEPLGADADTMDGLNVSGAIVDELHAHKTRDTYEILETATASRRQPLIFSITTAGNSQTTICWELHEYAQRVLDRVVEDDTFFAFIAAPDPGDDWTSPATWAKANPNLGISVKLDDLQRLCDKARKVPAAENAFRRLRLNEWTSQVTRYISLQAWDDTAGIVVAEQLKGRYCYAGLDLSMTTDITALELVFPPDGDVTPYDVLSFFWIPGEGLQERGNRDRVPYESWVKRGFIEATEGNVIHYGAIKKKLEALRELYDIREIAFDRWGASKLSQDLTDAGFTMVPFGQGYASMSSPTKELLGLVLAGKLHHGGNPVLRWMCDGMAVRQDPAGNIKPDKGKSTRRIDGMVALIMGLDRTLRHGSDETSVYETRGVITG